MLIDELSVSFEFSTLWTFTILYMFLYGFVHTFSFLEKSVCKSLSKKVSEKNINDRNDFFMLQ